MTWAEVAGLEAVTVVGNSTPLEAGVLEGDPRTRESQSGQTSQRVTLLLPSGARLDPPTRLVVRGVEMRVLGSKMPPWPGEPSLVSCERVNPDLPDALRLARVASRVLNTETGLLVDTAETLWEGAGHIESGVPASVDVAGEMAPVDRVTVTVPVGAPYEEGMVVQVVSSLAPGLAGGRFRASGELLDSGAVGLRRFVAYRLGL